MYFVRLIAATLVFAALAATALAASLTAAGPRLGGCAVFPASNAWNRDVSRDPVDPRSSAYIAAIGARGNRFLHADFGGGGAYGIPFSVVARSQPRVPIRFVDYGSESDRGPYPIPARARVEGGESSGGDRHVLALQSGTCRLFELFNAHRAGRGWTASSGAVFNLRSNRLRHEGWTSADAAGLPILPGLARYGEVRAGAIHHALRVTVPATQRGYIHPATHFASSSGDPGLPPMGLRLRLRSSFSLRGYHGQALVVLRALKRYGLLVADNGSGWFITGAADWRWNDDDLNQLKRVPGGAFEAVRSGAIRRG